MSAPKKPFAALIGTLAALMLSLFFAAGSASAAPTPPAPAATGPYSSVSFSISCSGGHCSGTLSGFISGEGVTISYTVTFQTAHRAGAPANPTVTLAAAKSYPLGSGTANAQGALSFGFDIPATAPPGGSIVFSGNKGTVISQAAPASFVGSAYVAPGSSSSASSSSSSNNASGNGSGSGTLSSTGVAVVGIGALGVVLLVGGALLLLAGRRRTGRAHI